MATRAHIYRRVSLDEQAESGAGLAAQLDACRAYAAKKGYEVVGDFPEDEGVSSVSSLDRRPALTLAIRELRRGDVLLVYKRDRIARDRMMIAMLEGILATKKCRLVSSQGEGTDADDPNDPMAVLMRGIVDLFAEFERLLIKFRVKGSLKAKRRRNERTGGVPYGYDLVDDGRRSKLKKDRKGNPSGNLPIALAPNPREQRVLAIMRSLRGKGWTTRRIAWALNRRNVATKAGGAWTHSSVAYILNRPPEDYPVCPAPPDSAPSSTSSAS